MLIPPTPNIFYIIMKWDDFSSRSGRHISDKTILFFFSGKLTT